MRSPPSRCSWDEVIWLPQPSHHSPIVMSPNPVCIWQQLTDTGGVYVAPILRRAILTGRGVPIGGQLKSHKLFAKSLETYVDHVDHAKIFSTSAGTSAEVGNETNTASCYAYPDNHLLSILPFISPSGL